MIISDVLYGEFEVDQVVEELILSKSVQRLKRYSSNWRKLFSEQGMECNAL